MLVTYVDTDSPACSDPCNKAHVWFLWVFEPIAAPQTKEDELSELPAITEPFAIS